MFKDYPLEDLVDFIDWKYFFDVWQLRGKYPNGRFPKIFNDATVGQEAKKLYEEAKVMLKKIIRNKMLTAKAIVGFYPANSDGDDILVYETDLDREAGRPPSAVFYGLRQQMVTEAQDSYQCISDLIAPKDSGIKDYIGVFATSAGFGCEELCAK